MKYWKPILLIALVFFAGTIFGVVATRVVTRIVIVRALRHPELVRERIERDLDRKLRLTSQQREQTHAALVEAQRRLHDLRGEVQPRFAEIITNTQSRIDATLTPEQQKKFESLKLNNRFLVLPSPDSIH